MQILYINSDFDEHELETKLYTSIEDFVKDRIGIAYDTDQLKELSEEPDENLDEAFVLELILSGYHVGEWSTEEVRFIKDGKFRQGLV